MNYVINGLRSVLSILFTVCFLNLTLISSTHAQGMLDYTGVWWPVNKDALVPELVIKQVDADLLMVYFFRQCESEASGKCFWGESKGVPHSIQNPQADPVQNTDEVTGVFSNYPEKVSFTISMPGKGILRLDMTSKSKSGVDRKIYSFSKKPTKPSVEKIEKPKDKVISNNNLAIEKAKVNPNLKLQSKVEMNAPNHLTKGAITGRAKGLTQHCTKYAVIILKEGERKSQFLDPAPESCAYTLNNLEPGKYLVSVLINYPHKDNYQILPGQIDNVVHVKAGQTTKFDFTIKHKEQPINNQVSGTLSNTRSCTIYQVSFYNPNTGISKSARFDANCGYVVKNLPPGTYRVILDFAGKADGVVNADPYPQTITVGKEDRKVIHFKLR
ncbi:MAG: carboxypeptidase-like regulatory domain-containing protein [Bacteroidota bacterium]